MAVFIATKCLSPTVVHVAQRRERRALSCMVGVALDGLGPESKLHVWRIIARRLTQRSVQCFCGRNFWRMIVTSSGIVEAIERIATDNGHPSYVLMDFSKTAYSIYLQCVFRDPVVNGKALLSSNQ